uniref:WbqC-like protein family protein n=1 Tax=Candidatus Kentrum sp. DK TaxID=2126562 RepID=A0A450T5T5_9GAMM|nr:MAG: WbqC-like protein family protein [Candidatus Kentron sp. DK]
MKLAIMQPYFFPYIGYFQLIHAADVFVVYDDVNFIKGSWINRNYILSQGQKTRITLQLQGASSTRKIKDVRLGDNRKKLLKSIQQNYARAPQYSVVMPLIEEVITFDEPNLAKYLEYGIREVGAYLGLSKRWVISSHLQKDSALRGQDKVLAICRELGADHYINLPGGAGLYARNRFEQENIQLSFIAPQIIEYRQFGNKFEPYLSIIDIIMFNDRARCNQLLNGYVLVQN